MRQLRRSIRTAVFSLVVAAPLALTGPAARAAPERDIIDEVDPDDASGVSITHRLERINAILDKANNRYVAVDATFALPPDPCVPVLTHVTDELPECLKQIQALDLAQQQTFTLQDAIAAVDSGGDSLALQRRMDRTLASFQQAETGFAGIIAPEFAGIIAPEFAGIIAPERVGIIAPELVAIIAPEYAGIIAPEMPGIIAPELSGIIAPERFADMVGIIAPELPSDVVGANREAALAEIDAALLQAEKRLLTLAALREAIATAP